MTSYIKCKEQGGYNHVAKMGWMVVLTAVMLTGCGRSIIQDKYDQAKSHAKGTSEQRLAALKEFEEILAYAAKAATSEYYLAQSLSDQYLKMGFWDKAIETAE